MFKLLLLFIVVSQADEFRSWMAKNNKHYKGAEFLRRKAIFRQNTKFVKSFNEKHSFKLSMDGPFAAMTNEEYNKMLKPREIKQEIIENKKLSVKKVADAVDWRAEGKVTPVRDQGACGSCYAFGSLAALESRLLIAGKTSFTVNNLDLSEQQIVDCNDKNAGCDGGAILYVFAYTKNHGVMKESDYKYTEVQGTCVYDESKIVVRNGGEKLVTQTSEEELTAALAEGPVTVAIDASQISFQLYAGGVYDEESCKKWVLNHAVCAVGYGATSDGKEYYIVKNSWGESWGDAGYILMSRNNNNQCGIANDALYPTDVVEA